MVRGDGRGRAPMKIVTIVGARPQFIKAAPVSGALRTMGGVEEVLVHTGQHYDPALSQVFFDELAIPSPRHHLEVGSGSHAVQTGQMLQKIEAVLRQESPHWVLVYGDTNSTLAGALAAAKLNIPVAHVEAGLRSFNRHMPEEINRLVADGVAALLFAPTATAVRNLQREGVAASKIRLVGDVMYDSVLQFGAKAARESHILRRLELAPRSFLLFTLHRAETTDDTSRLRAIAAGLGKVGQRHRVVFPMHPRTKKVLGQSGLLAELERQLQVIDPVGYLDMLMLEQQAKLIVTDSGGVQKEAFFFRVPCVTLRNETEWVELIDAGWNRLADPGHADIVAREILSAAESPPPSVRPPALYGDGRASAAIAMFFSGESDRLGIV